jgi:hypothetical protein
MWVCNSYLFKANDGEFINIRGELTRESKEGIITKKQGELSPLYNYNKDASIHFIESSEGDYILVSGLHQERPTVYNGNLELNRFVDVISTNQDIVDLIIKKINGVVSKHKRLEEKVD